MVLIHPGPGRRVLLPCETTRNAHGSNDEADVELGHSAWSAILKLLRLQS
jgi:hypothetical protein